MSATGRSKVRRKDDNYSTPGWCTQSILPHLIASKGKVVLDPCCGIGNILAVVRAFGLSDRTCGIEIDSDRATQSRTYGIVDCRDVLNEESWNKPDLILTNPPYSLAEKFARRALSEVAFDGFVCMLLRLNWLGSKKRAPFHKTYPSDVYVLSKRPSFTGDGTDATEYAWFVWGPGCGNRWFLV